MTRTITIASGKGGVGKSNISVNLSLALTNLGRRTCLFDADLGLANANILLGLYPSKTLEDAIVRGLSIKEIIMRTEDGLDLIPGSSGLEIMANLAGRELKNMTASLSALDDYDYLIFDASSGISRQVVSFCLAASEIFLIINPEPTSLIDA